MEIDYNEISKQIIHAGEKGTIREDIIKEFLVQYLPQRYTIERGLIINVNGQQSNQQDLFIFDNEITPRFVNYEHVKVVPIESVRCVIEVKSILTTDELTKAFKNINFLRSFDKEYFCKEIKSEFPFGVIFSYESQITLEKIKSILIKFGDTNGYQNMPTMIVVLNRGAIVSCSKEDPTNYILLPDENVIWALQNVCDIGSNLMLFYLVIISGLFYHNPSGFHPNIFKYAYNSGYESPKKSFSREELKGAVINFDGKKINIDKMYEVQDLFKSMTREERMSKEAYMKIIQALKEALPDSFFD